jgi:hypothetical protein
LPRSTGFWFLSQLGFNPPMRTAKRTVAVMVENHENARPHHKGLENATLIEEFLVEGGISRFAAIFDVSNLPSVVGPVRSLRPYFVDGVRPWASAILYAGGSPEAFARVENVPGMKHANGLALPKDFLRDEEIAAPHNLFLPGDRAEELLGTLEINPVLWPPFPAGGAPLTGSAATTIHLNFLSPVHNVTYDYSPWQGYTRTNGEVTEITHPANVLILEEPIAGIGEVGRLTIEMSGHGNAVLFRGGMAFPGSWEKKDAGAPLTIVDENGDRLPFADGQTWMTVLPTLQRVRWE